MEIVYPDVDAVVEANKIVLKEIKALKADRHDLLAGGKQKIQKVLDNAENAPTDIYGKAAILIVSLAKAHAFASGNRRTAYVVTKEFLIHNTGSAPELNGKVESIMKASGKIFILMMR